MSSTTLISKLNQLSEIENMDAKALTSILNTLKNN